MIGLEMKNCIMMSPEILQIYLKYLQVKLINMNVLQGKKYCLLIKVEC